MSLRTCKNCGKVAFTEADLKFFVKDPRSKHGRRNMCTSCETRRVNGEKKPKELSCNQCGQTFSILEAHKHFRRTKPTGDKVIGELSRICKECEKFNAEEKGEEFIEIQGKLVPKDFKERSKKLRITSVSIGALG